MVFCLSIYCFYRGENPNLVKLAILEEPLYFIYLVQSRQIRLYSMRIFNGFIILDDGCDVFGVWNLRWLVKLGRDGE